MEKNTTLTFIIDMQVDFTTGALANKDAENLIPNMVKFIKESEARGEKVVFTRDTHGAQYLATNEGRNLPVPHCILGTEGHKIVPKLLTASVEKNTVNKPNFGMTDEMIKEIILNNFYWFSDVKTVKFVGTCTDICVVSNALTVKHLLPDAEVIVYEDLCAGVTPESHEAALTTMRMCQVKVEKYFN